MLQILRRNSAAVERVMVSPDWRLPQDAVWIELVAPTREEELAVEAELRLDLPTREEMAEIEASSRLYQQDGATFMTATLLCGGPHAETPTSTPVTFVLVGERLATIRYAEPRAFSAFAAMAERQPELRRSGVDAFLGVLETVVDGTADLLERLSAEVESISAETFRPGRTGGFRPILNRLAAAQGVNGKARESLVSLARLISYANLASQMADNHDAHEQLRSLQRDVQSLTEHPSHVSGDLTFLLDAALGLINIEQNEITKIFSIAAVVFLPPTLIAGWYGMNFHHMPELSWPWAYPAAAAAMVLSAVGPLLWIKRKGWL